MGVEFLHWNIFEKYIQNPCFSKINVIWIYNYSVTKMLYMYVNVHLAKNSKTLLYAKLSFYPHCTNFCIWLHKAIYIKAIVAMESDVAYGPLLIVFVFSCCWLLFGFCIFCCCFDLFMEGGPWQFSPQHIPRVFCF